MFKVAILAPALILAITVARAETLLSLQCTPQLAPSPRAKDPIVSIDVTVQEQNWQVVHVAASGARYERAAQYWLRDISSRTSIAWEGTLVTRPQLKMRGEVIGRDGNFLYRETIYDANKGGAKTMETTSICQSIAATTPAPPNPNSCRTIAGEPCQPIGVDGPALAVNAVPAAAATPSPAPKGVHDAPDGQRAKLTDFKIKTRDDENRIPGDELYVRTEAAGLITNLTDGRLETAICIIAYDNDGLQVSRDWSYGINLGLGQSDTDSIVSWPMKKKLWQQVKTLKIFATRYCAIGGSPSKDNDSPIIQMDVN
jgi:hypothetical protein